MRRILFRLRGIILNIGRKKPGARVMVIRDGNILLIRHTYVDGWYLVGGGVEKNETPEQAACRELMEETGITAKILVPFGVYQAKDSPISIFICESFDKKNVRSLEIAEEKWFPLTAPPPGTSPATRRRIREYLKEIPVGDRW
jgi:8-oxo-dGTP pyrophosphatase MutT (NUDIX family)